MALEKYRKTMTEDVLHSWAGDAQLKINTMNLLLSQLRSSLEPSFRQSKEGREYLNKIDSALRL